MKKPTWTGTDRRIYEVLKAQADALPISPESAERMKQRVCLQLKEEERMKHWNMKKIIVTAAIICTFGGITAIAAGKMVSISSHSSHNDEFKQYSQIQTTAVKIGLEVKAPERFSNGYQFSYGVPGESSGKDESGNTVKQWKDLFLNYEKSGLNSVFISIQPVQTISGMETPDKTFQLGDISLSYSSTAYLFVPPDYTVSEEDLKLQEEGKLMISYGSSEVERQQFQSISWAEGGSFYILSSFDNPMSPEDFYQMALEIIQSR